MKILEKLWYGNINPQGLDAQKDPRMEQALYLVVKNEDTIISFRSLEGIEFLFYIFAASIPIDILL